MIAPSGDYKICCFSGFDVANIEKNPEGSHGMCVDEKGKVMNVLTHSIQDALNSKYHKQIRLAQSKNERHPMCEVCWTRDDANASKGQKTTSLRYFRSFVQLVDMDNAVTMEKASTVIQEDGSIDEYPISLDLRFTNVCNMKCIMCSSKYSNQWYEDEAKMGRGSFHYGNKKYNFVEINGIVKSDIIPWHESSIWWDQFDSIKDRIRHIYVTGGEPFIIKGHDVLLDKLIEHDLAKNIIMEYDTNLSVINNKLLDKLKAFKDVLMAISCDDIGEQYELIRFPGKFSTITKNLEFLNENNFKIRYLSSCIGIYSIFSPIRLYDHFSKLGYTNEKDYVFRFLRQPNDIDISFLPVSVKKKIIAVYEKSNLVQKWKNFVIGHLENNMKKYTEEESKIHLKRFVRYMDKLDEIRGTDWRKTFPDVVEILDGYI
jgi:organic radical activating enzyme